MCAIVGSPEKPSDIYWIDGDDAKIKYKSTSKYRVYFKRLTVKSKIREQKYLLPVHMEKVSERSKFQRLLRVTK